MVRSKWFIVVVMRYEEDPAEVSGEKPCVLLIHNNKEMQERKIKSLLKACNWDEEVIE